jgi:hypothetical protein
MGALQDHFPSAEGECAIRVLPVSMAELQPTHSLAERPQYVFVRLLKPAVGWGSWSD